jgi:site-specific recombinase XerD
LAPLVLGECSEWLAGLGYSPGSAAGVVNVLERLSWWMQLAGAEVDDIDEDLLARFLAVEGARDLPCVSVKRRIATMHRFLTADGGRRVGAVVAFGRVDRQRLRR